MPDIIKYNDRGDPVILENHWDQPVQWWTDDELREALFLCAFETNFDIMIYQNELADRERTRGLYEPPVYV